jgi:hypothetical protein
MFLKLKTQNLNKFKSNKNLWDKYDFFPIY